MGKIERAYTVPEVAKKLGLSPRVVTQLFEHEKGVFIYEVPNALRRRKSYRTIRIPRHVYERVKERYTVR